MSESKIQTVELRPPPLSKFQREYQAFLRQLPDLLQTHRGKYVAIHEEKVVGEGTVAMEVAEEAYRQFGYVELYVGLVAVPHLECVRIPHYRIINASAPA